MEGKAVTVTVYKWAGHWGMFEVKTPCGECALTLDIIHDTLETELIGIPVELEIREWLSEWWKPLVSGGFHAPIVMVEGKVISQGAAINRGVLTEKVIQAYTHISEVDGNVIFGKTNCPYCRRAKKYLDEKHIIYEFRDVVKNPRNLYEMLNRVKPLIGQTVPITVPQIWIGGEYVGDAHKLSELLETEVEPNPERGKCSLSA